MLILLKIGFYISNHKYGLFVLINGVNQYMINLVINLLIVIITLLLLNNNAKKVRKYIQSVAAILLIVFLFINHGFSYGDKVYFFFQSPDHTKTLVAEENSFLLGGWCDFYEQKGIFIKKIGGRITTDDGFRPFSSDYYKLSWLDNSTVEIYYNYGSGAGSSPVYKTTTIHLWE